jgi:hypothetical protein
MTPNHFEDFKRDGRRRAISLQNFGDRNYARAMPWRYLGFQADGGFTSYTIKDQAGAEFNHNGQTLEELCDQEKNDYRFLRARGCAWS